LIFASIGDLNSDDNSELVIGYSIVDIKLFNEDKFNPDAYKTHILIVDSKSEIIREIPFIKVYLIGRAIIGNLLVFKFLITKVIL